MTEVLCELCGKSFNKAYNLRRHYKNVHHGYNPLQLRMRSPPKLECPLCSEVFHRSHRFNDHLLKIHKIEVKSQQFSFTDENEFMLWKTSLEDHENTSFTKHRGAKSGKIEKIDKILYYRCNRSGYYTDKISPTKRKRNLKVQGSSKINAYCPARIRAIIEKDKVIVDYCKTHVGHDIEMAHVPLTPKVRKEIASKIAENLPFETIIDDVESSVTHEIKRKHLLTKQDLRNIVREYSLDGKCVDQIDRATWVQEECISEISYENTCIKIEYYDHCEETTTSSDNPCQEVSVSDHHRQNASSFQNPCVEVVGYEYYEEDPILFEQPCQEVEVYDHCEETPQIALNESEEDKEAHTSDDLVGLELLKGEAKNNFLKILNQVKTVEQVDIIKNSLLNLQSKIDLKSEKLPSFEN